MKFFSTIIYSFFLLFFFFGFSPSQIDAWFLNANAQTAFPDLIIESLSYTVTAARAEIRFNLTNRGAADSGRTTFVINLLDRDGNALSHRLIGLEPLAPGASVVRSTRSDSDNSELAHLPPGTAKARIRVDQNNTIAESNEDNNVAEVDRPFPDLAIEGLSYTITAERAELSFNVANRGTLVSGYSTFTWNLLDDNGNVTASFDRSIGLEPLAPGASVVRSFRSDAGYPVLISPPPGTAKAEARIDQDNMLDESNEDNNVSVVDRPFIDLAADLTIESLVYTITAERAELSFNVANRGALLSGPTTFIWNLFDADDNIIPGVGGHSINLDALAPGASVVRSFRSDIGYSLLAHPPEGKLKIKVRVDQNNRVSESNEDNNVAEVDRPFPDLVIEGLSYTITAERAELIFNVANRGTLTSGYSTFTWNLLDDNGNVTASFDRSIGLEPLAPGASVVRSFRSDAGYPVLISPPTGTVKAQVLVDQNNAIIEFDEGNNIQERLVITPETTAEDLVANDEGSALPTTQVSLPGSLPYFFRNLGQQVRTFFTFNPERRAELQLQQANERIIEVGLLAARGDTERAARHLQAYQNDILHLSAQAQVLENRNRQTGREFSIRLLQSELEHQGIIGQLEHRASSESLAVVKEAREKTLDAIGKTAGRIQEKQLDKILSAAFISEGSPFNNLRNLEVLKAVEEKVPDVAKDAIRHATENSLKRFKSQLEVLPGEYQKLLPRYVEKVGGDEVTYLKVFDDLQSQGMTEAAQKALLDAKTKVVQRFEKRVQDASENPVATKALLQPFADGAIDDLRVLKDIEASPNANFQRTFDAAKQEVFKNFQDTVKHLDSPEKQQEFIERTVTPVAEEVKRLRDDAKVFDVSAKPSLPIPKIVSPVQRISPPNIPQEKLIDEILCTQVYVPVCGVDGKTYSNRCVAEEQNKVKIAYEGECKKVIPPPVKTSESSLPQLIPLPILESEPLKPLAPIPLPVIVCTKEYFPICGVDGKTYINKCLAIEANVAVAYSGECKAPPTVLPPVVIYQCSDGVDNDKDGAIDLKDSGCTDGKDNDETNVVSLPTTTFAPTPTPIPIPISTIVPQCNDGIDNDKDGFIDLKDLGCTDAQDNDEINIVVEPPPPLVVPLVPSPLPLASPVSQCSDGIDNDKDGFIDLKDLGCADAQDNDEINIVAPPSLTKTITKPVISSFAAIPTVISRGQSSTLSWNITGATSITLSPTVSFIKEILAASGKKVVTPTLTTVYSITATNSAGSVSASVAVSVK